MKKEITFKQYKTALKIVKDFQCDNNITPESIIYNADISGRTIRCLYAVYRKDMTIRELSKISLRRIFRLRGIGKKSLSEIINLYNNVGLSYIN